MIVIVTNKTIIYMYFHKKDFWDILNTELH